jgi:D-alanyl-D-alanine carboxypeptidase (penicillin-binding protein 5/6)
MSIFAISYTNISPPPAPTTLAGEIATATPLATTQPVLGTAREAPIISAQGVQALDLGTGTILYEKEPHMELLPASTTKIMTALIALENFSEDDIVTIGNIVTSGKKMYLAYGEQITVEGLLYGALVPSANDAAEALASFDPLGRDHFIELMNNKAGELGMTDTVFKNPSGLESDGHVSSARDMLILGSAAMQNPKFPKYVQTKDITVTSVDGGTPHHLTNVNELLGIVDGVKGVKTGWTENARENLVTYIERGDKKVMVALMGSQDRFGETRELIDWIFENYNWTEVQLPPDGAGDGVGSAP